MLERRLAAILAADVVGYSRLMSTDEAGTLAALKSCETELIEPAVRSKNGRIVKRMGDGYLIEFASAVDAVQCALHWQETCESAAEGQLRFRIGINLGDIIHQDGDIYGDGVNIAARLEGLAATGGICISTAVHEQVRRKIETKFESLGERSLKNIDEAVGIFGWPLTGGTGAGQQVDGRPADPNMLLVVPFRAVGSDLQASSLAEGLTETIAVAMSHFDELTILDPGAVPADANIASGRELGKSLDVLYLLEGRVQVAAGQARISVQVIEVESGQRQWSDSFDRDLSDVFALQDELTAIVASTVGEALLDLMSKALDKKPRAQWSAKELTIRGISHLHRLQRDQVLIAREFFQQALAKDPEVPLAILCECWTYMLELMLGWPPSLEDTLGYCLKRVERLLARNERQSQAHRLMTRIYHMTGDPTGAMAHAERAYELNPYDSDMLVNLGQALVFTGQSKRGVELIERATRNNPYAPGFYKDILATAQMMAEQYEDALVTIEKIPKPGPILALARIACLILSGRTADGRAEMEKLCAARPDLTVETHRQNLPYSDGPDLERYLGALRQAGLPSESTHAPPLCIPAHTSRPSIAVLPFENLSNDPDREFLANGMTEEIITTLSKISSLFVISRNSILSFKGKRVDAQEAGKELGARYLLEGSVRSSGSRVRVNAQLTDAANGHHLWASRFDRELDDVFAMQDELTKEIVSSLQVELTEGEQAKLAASSTRNFEAWQLAFEGRDLVHMHRKDTVRKGRKLIEQATDLDPEYVFAWGSLAEAYWKEAANEGWSDTPQRTLELALEASDKALALDPEEPVILAMRSVILVTKREFGDARELAERALRVAHSEANAIALATITLRCCGLAEEGLSQLEQAKRYCRVYPAWYPYNAALCHWILGQHDEAVAALSDSIGIDPEFSLAYALLAAIHAEIDNAADAARAAKSLLHADPMFSARTYTESRPFQDPELTARLRRAMKKAGLPD